MSQNCSRVRFLLVRQPVCSSWYCLWDNRRRFITIFGLVLSAPLWFWQQPLLYNIHALVVLLFSFWSTFNISQNQSPFSHLQTQRKWGNCFMPLHKTMVLLAWAMLGSLSPVTDAQLLGHDQLLPGHLWDHVCPPALRWSCGGDLIPTLLALQTLFSSLIPKIASSWCSASWCAHKVNFCGGYYRVMRKGVMCHLSWIFC